MDAVWIGVAAGPSTATVLSLLLTTEGLLFAALSISVALAGSSTFGTRTIVPPAFLAFMAAGVLGVVASAALLAWSDLFLGAGWPQGWNGRVEASALVFAIVVQPLVALIIAIGIWRG